MPILHMLSPCVASPIARFQSIELRTTSAHQQEVCEKRDSPKTPKPYAARNPSSLGLRAFGTGLRIWVSYLLKENLSTRFEARPRGHAGRRIASAFNPRFGLGGVLAQNPNLALRP